MQIVSPFNGLNIDYRIIAAIIGAVVAFQVFIETTEYNSSMITDVFALGTILTVVTSGAYLTFRYKDSKVFGSSAVFLTLGFTSLAIGKIITMSGVNIYPTAFSLSFFALYFFISLQIYVTINGFKQHFGFKDILITSPIILALISLFYTITYADYGHSDFNLHFCGASVVGASILASLSIRGFSIVKNIPFGNSWKLYTLGLVLFTFNDIWFHYLDTLSIYTNTHYVNLLMYASFMIIAYSLQLHKKTF